MSDFVAVVTGGNKGIGADLAGAMADCGWQVISIARSAPQDNRIAHLGADLTDPAAVAAAAEALRARGDVTHIVHNAGMILPNLIDEARPEDLAALTQLHLAAPLVLTQAVLPAMRARRFGRVLFNGSRAALGAKTRTAYGATKAAITGMARTWALELAGDGITVNVVAPGPVLTDNFWGIVPKDSPQQDDLARRIPVGRLGTVEDITRAFLFFADPGAGFVTGQTLYVCGGASIGSVPI